MQCAYIMQRKSNYMRIFLWLHDPTNSIIKFGTCYAESIHKIFAVFHTNDGEYVSLNFRLNLFGTKEYIDKCIFARKFIVHSIFPHWCDVHSFTWLSWGFNWTHFIHWIQSYAERVLKSIWWVFVSMLKRTETNTCTYACTHTAETKQINA